MTSPAEALFIARMNSITSSLSLAALANQLAAETFFPELITTTDMVFYRERDNERPPLSLILPHLYLGAETDVTQECLNSRGISYVLSVSRCSPQPTFVPRSKFLRIPIDDSLWDDLLAWIPAALRFIDGAVSSGGSVLVHCAAGISRSPALAVAYIMYSLGMDLDHAYRFVKERRPSISPNFNFLGQLQSFQGALSQKASNGGLVIQPLKPLNDNNNHSFTGSPAANKVIDLQGSSVTNEGTARADQTYSQKLYNAEQRYSQSGEVGKGSILSGTPQSEQNSTHATLSLSGKLRTLHISLNQNQREVQTIYDSSNASSYEPAKPTPKPLNLQLPACNSSLLEKRKGLTLSLSPLGTTPIVFNNAIMRNACSPTESSPQCSGSSKYINQRELASGRHSNKPAELLCHSPVETPAGRERNSCGGKYARSGHVSPQDQVKPDRDGTCQGRKATSCSHSAGRKSKDALVQNKGKDPINNLVQHKGKGSTRRRADTKCSTVVHLQPSAETRLALCDLEPEVSNEDSGLLSPLNLTVNKIIGWGERMLLGVLLGPRIKMGHVALPYRC